MEIKKRHGNYSDYHYPKWVTSVQKIELLNMNPTFQLFASELTILYHGRISKRFDLRLWKNGEPTCAGVYFSLRTARLLRDDLDQFIKEQEESD